MDGLNPYDDARRSWYELSAYDEARRRSEYDNPDDALNGTGFSPYIKTRRDVRGFSR